LPKPQQQQREGAEKTGEQSKDSPKPLPKPPQQQRERAEKTGEEDKDSSKPPQQRRQPLPSQVQLQSREQASSHERQDKARDDKKQEEGGDSGPQKLQVYPLLRTIDGVSSSLQTLRLSAPASMLRDKWRRESMTLKKRKEPEKQSGTVVQRTKPTNTSGRSGSITALTQSNSVTNSPTAAGKVEETALKVADHHAGHETPAKQPLPRGLQRKKLSEEIHVLEALSRSSWFKSKYEEMTSCNLVHAVIVLNREEHVVWFYGVSEEALVAAVNECKEFIQVSMLILILFFCVMTRGPLKE
jgi:hypothetical protein